jgi:hypothetical protein
VNTVLVTTTALLMLLKLKTQAKLDINKAVGLLPNSN